MDEDDVAEPPLFTGFQARSSDFEPLIIHQHKPLKYHCFKGFCFEYFEYEFSAETLLLLEISTFSVGVLFGFTPDHPANESRVFNAKHSYAGCSGHWTLYTHVKHQCFQRFGVFSFEYFEYFL